MFENLLPLGSIVKIKNDDRQFMICGRVVTMNGSDDVYDYVGCLYPQGLYDPKNMFFFRQNGIEECVFRGYEDEQELAFRKNVLDPLGEVEVIDGNVFPKNR